MESKNLKAHLARCQMCRTEPATHLQLCTTGAQLFAEAGGMVEVSPGHFRKGRSHPNELPVGLERFPDLKGLERHAIYSQKLSDSAIASLGRAVLRLVGDWEEEQAEARREEESGGSS